METTIAEVPPWRHLESGEWDLVAPKLAANEPSGELTDSDLETARQGFTRVLVDWRETALDADVIAERLLTLRNFMKQTRARDEQGLWHEIRQLKGIRSSYLELTVFDRDSFIARLDHDEYLVNREPFWTIHKFDSARARTSFSNEPSLHFANDRADEEAYGPNYFFVHWDLTSVWFRQARLGRFPGAKWLERILAGRKHHAGFAQPQIVSAYIGGGESKETPATLG